MSFFSSSRAVAIIGPCCWARVMLVVSALITPKRRVRILKSSNTTSSMLKPTSRLAIKPNPGGRCALSGSPVEVHQ